ncbi:MAG: hypothetical protein NTX05_00085 [Fusobacteria bacterium]|nr:hypothetical protein [Fusobacteriota bacterium]
MLKVYGINKNINTACPFDIGCPFHSCNSNGCTNNCMNYCNVQCPSQCYGQCINNGGCTGDCLVFCSPQNALKK